MKGAAGQADHFLIRVQEVSILDDATKYRFDPKLETVFLVPALDLTYLSSSLVREVARFGGDVSQLVQPAVQQALRRKFGR